MTKRKKKKPPQKKTTARKGDLAHFFRVNWPLIKIYLMFGAVLLVVFGVIMIKSVYTGVIMPFNEFLAWSSMQALHLFGDGDIIGSGTTIQQDAFSIDIAEGCNGIYALTIVIAGIVAFPAPWKPKTTGLILAVILIMLLNYIRILTLWYAGRAGSFVFDAMHLYVWEFIIIALGGAFWYLWYEKCVKKR